MTITAHPNTKDKFQALQAVLKALNIAFDVTDKNNTEYNQQFIQDIEKGKQDVANGNVKKMSLNDFKDLCK
jgi:hypothetical protein